MLEPTQRTARPPKWAGWGDPEKRMALPAAALEMLRSELGETEPMRSVELDEVALPAPRPLPGAIVDAVNQASVLVAHEQLVRRSAGRSYPDLVRLRSGRLAAAPDAVVMPGNPAQLADVLEICAREGIAVVPFGGGTSVVGGVDAVAGPHERLISLDLRRIRSVEIDRVSLVATL